MMSTNLLNFAFFGKTPQHLKKCWDVGAVSRRFAAREALVKPKPDRLLEKAKTLKYRSRSAFKLIEFDQKYQLLKPGYKVLDIGAAPGAWSEFLACRTNANRSDPNSPTGLVIAVDTANFDDIDGVITLPNTDFLKQSSQNKIMDYLGQGQKFDFIFSDMTSETGVETFDRERHMKLVYCVIMFSVKSLKPGGGVLVKIWNQGEKGGLKSDMKKFFESIEFAGLKTGKLSISETFVIGTNFQGLK